ncbi:MAG TPA: 2-oxoacid:acceptor oxidoreductase family protein, partial [Syntrophomonas sp.]|nr:2-oxoacid:acceptor oxidoreductase family protein [Syntrophomonas sp.]
LIFSGIGGQGVILAGKILCSVAAGQGYTVSLSPAYGQEKRGGRTSCQCVLGEKIGSPVISYADVVLVMDEKSLLDYEKRVKKGGWLLINSSMVKNQTSRTDVKIIEIPLNEIANQLGNPRTVNMVALGAAVKCAEVLPLDKIKEQIDQQMKSSIAEVNKNAAQAGYEYAANI